LHKVQLLCANDNNVPCCRRARLPSGVPGSSGTGKQSRKTRQKRKQSAAARKAHQRKKKRK